MPTKITPFPKVAGGGGGKAGGKTTTTKTTTTKATKKSKFFATSRFSTATRGFSTVAAARGRGYLQAILFTACVGLGLLTLGIVLLYLGDDKFIVDIMVLGGLCILMGLGSLVVGCAYALRPIFKARKMNSNTEKGSAGAAQAPGTTQDSYFIPAFAMDVLAASPRPAPGTSTSAPGKNDLYDQDSLRATRAPRGKFIPPSPPFLSQPSLEGTGTTSTVLTTTDADSDELSDLSVLGEGAEAVR